MGFAGIYTPLVTPFAKDGAIDWDGWDTHVERQVECGVNGLIASGSTGEFYALSMEERAAQARRLKEVASGRVELMMGVNALRLEDSLELARLAAELSMDGLLLAAPPYSLPDDRELAGHCVRIASEAGLPVMLYNFPARTGVDMGTGFLRLVSGNGHIVAIKESGGDIARLHELACMDTGLDVLCGADDMALEFYAWGAVGWVSAAANAVPEEVVAMHDCCAVKGDLSKGRKIIEAIMPLMKTLEESGKFIQCVKRACDVTGLPGGDPRPPLLPIDKDLASKVDQAMREAGNNYRALR